MLMNTLDSTIVNVALVTLGREFDVPPVMTEAVVVAYLVSLAVFIPASGWLGDRFGTKRVFLTALALFVGASALLRTGSEPGAVGRLPGAARGRWRAAHPRRHGHALPHLPTAGAHRRRPHPHVRHDPRPGLRSHPRRVPHRAPLLALGVLRQYPRRTHRLRHRVPLPARASRARARTLRSARIRAGRRRSGSGHVRPERGTATRMDVARHCRQRNRRGPHTGDSSSPSSCARPRRWSSSGSSPTGSSAPPR